jgi:hypothetical protein
MPQSVYVGLAVTSHNTAQTSTATFTNVSVGNTASNQRPTVTLTAPAAGATYTAPASMTLAATASDPDGTVTQVAFYANGQQIGSADPSSPYTVAWSNVPQGTYNLTAVATDNTAATTTSATVSVTVNAAANQPPTVSITSPANGATFTAGANMTITASAADSNGSVTRVDFYRGTTLIAQDSSAPYSATWSSAAAGSYALTAIAYDNGGASTTSAAVNVTVGAAGGLPTPWSSRDVGSPALSGSATLANNVFTVTGAGVDVWDAADQFQFVYQTVQGDVEVIARVDTLQGPDAWSKGGVMLRETLTTGSPNVYAAATMGNGWTFQRRRVADGPSEGIPTRPSGVAPGWVRLVRTGTQVTGYYSSNGSTWTQYGTDTVSMAATLYVGLAVTSHNASQRATATFSNVTVRPLSSQNQPPSVSITSPANGATFTAGANITITASAADSNGSVTRVDFYRGATLIAQDSSAPYSATWSSAAAGSYALTAIAYDNGGASTTSAAVNVTVSGGTSPPPTRVVFNPSPDHATSSVTSYSVALRRAGDATTATPVATKNLGKPSPVNNDITVDISDIVNPLPAGSYYAIVTAIGPNGSGASTPSANFTK